MKLDNQYWRVEFWRLALVGFIALVGAIISGQWLLCLVLSLSGYIIWLLSKLYKFNCWLNDGSNPDELTDNDGIWLRLETRIIAMNRKGKKHKKRTSKILKRFQGIIKGLPYATVVLNGNNEIEWANEKALDFLNIDLKKDRGQRVDNIIRIPSAVKLFNKNTNSDIEVSFPHNTDRRLALQYVVVQKDLKLVLASDISDRINVQQMRKNFISNASHELRTPLTVIAGYLEMMSDDDTLPDHLRTAVEQADSQSARMKSIVEDMLTLSRLEKSELDEESCTNINIPIILQRICTNEIQVISNKTQTINTQIDSSLHIKGIETEIISVLNNLIQNAVRHTPEGTKISVEWLKNTAGEACFSVVDDGPGIPDEHLPHLTQRFYRVDQSRSRENGGTGLGLAIVQHIINRHGGKMTITSTFGKGSNFVVVFPKDKTIEIKTAMA